MAWELLHEDIVWADDMGCLPGMKSLPPAQQLRVTVERWAEECCDKYRGRTITLSSGPGGARIVDRKTKFCPECGKRL
jgi:hypothetical protein